MRSRTRASRAAGFTIIELAIVLAVVAILSAAAVTSLSRGKTRASLLGATTELASLLHQARQTALGTGTPVAVLLYKGYSAPGSLSTGYVIVYQDACFDFFSGGATCGVTYATYDPAVLAFGTSGTTKSAVLDTMTLPRGVIVGPANGMGTGTTLRAPIAGIPVDVDCSFCGTTGGAVVFDASGQASFYSLAGGSQTGPLAVNGGASVSLGYDTAVTPDLTGQRTLVILSASGVVRLLAGG